MAPDDRVTDGTPVLLKPGHGEQSACDHPSRGGSHPSAVSDPQEPGKEIPRRRQDQPKTK